LLHQCMATDLYASGLLPLDAKKVGLFEFRP
jgi:hypothetical protein